MKKGDSMSLIAKLETRAQAGRPVRVGLIGAGKFGSMYLSQAPRTPGIHLVCIADLSPARPRSAMQRVGWEEARYSAGYLAETLIRCLTFFNDVVDLIIPNYDADNVITAKTHPTA